MRAYRGNGNLVAIQKDDVTVELPVDYELIIRNEKYVTMECLSNRFYGWPPSQTKLRFSAKFNDFTLYVNNPFWSSSTNFVNVQKAVLEPMEVIVENLKLKNHKVKCYEYTLANCRFSLTEKLQDFDFTKPMYKPKYDIDIGCKSKSICLTSASNNPDAKLDFDSIDGHTNYSVIKVDAQDMDSDQADKLLKDLLALVSFAKTRTLQWFRRRELGKDNEVIREFWRSCSLGKEAESGNAVCDRSLELFLKDSYDRYLCRTIEEKSLITKAIYLWTSSQDIDLFHAKYILAFSALECLANYFFPDESKDDLKEGIKSLADQAGVVILESQIKDIKDLRNAIAHSGDFQRLNRGVEFTWQNVGRIESNMNVIIRNYLVKKLTDVDELVPWCFERNNTIYAY